MEAKRKIYIDMLRILACVAVIFNHFDPGFYNSSYIGFGRPSYFFMLFLSILCKFAVPLFFMISGALLLGKKESTKDIIKKRLSRIILSLLFASILFYFFE